MSVITIEQHWYGSAPVGLEVSRGFQTIAHSEGLEEYQSLKPHCSYKRPSGLREGALPVNWGWFPLDEKHVCIHRVAYSGTDELGRPGNFLAHNLKVTTADLDKIDYDIPLLLRWVEQHSPIKYTDEEGRQSGFAGSYAELYAVLDPGAETPRKEKLSEAPLLQPDLDELRRLRKEMDRDWKGAFLDELRQRLKPEGLLALVQAFLCPAPQRRPVLLVGVGNGADNSALERKVAEYLFSVLPFHVRRGLTFATYEHDVAAALGATRTGPAALSAGPGGRPLPAGVPAPALAGRPGAPPQPVPLPRPGAGALPPGMAPAPSAGSTPALSANRNRRLLMTTTHNEVRLGGAGGGDLVWQWHTQSGAMSFPPPSEIARVLCPWVKADAFPNVLAFWDLASRYSFTDEWQGLLDAWASRDLHKKALAPEDYDLFLRLAESWRACQPYPRGEVRPPHLLAVATRMVQQAEDVLRTTPEMLDRVARVYLKLLVRQCASLGEAEKGARLAEAATVVGSFFRWALLPGNVDLLRYLLEAFSRSDTLLELRRPAATAFTEAVAGPSHLERVEELLGVWADAKQQLPEEARGQLFLGEVANALMALLERADRANYSFSKEPERIVLPILRTIPVEGGTQLGWRLGLLARLTGQPDLGGALLASLLRTGRVPEGVLSELRRQPHELVLRYYREWQAAGDSVPGPVQPLLGQPGLLVRYWECPADRAPHSSIPALLADLQALARAGACAEAARAYFESGYAPLSSSLQGDPRPLSRGLLEALTEAHCGLLEFLHPHATDPAEGSLLSAHLSALLAFLLARPRSRDWDESGAGNVLRQPLRLLVQWFPAPASRVQVLAEVANQVSALRAHLKVPAEEQVLLLRPMTALLQQLGVEKGEAFWHSLWLNEVVRQPDTPENMTRRVATRLLDQLPGLAEHAAQQTPFGRWLGSRLDREVYRGLARRLLQSLQGEDIAQEAARWFVPEHGRAALLAQMEAQGLLPEVGERLTQMHGSGDGSSMAALGVLVNLPLPGPVAQPVRQRMQELLLHKLEGIVQRTEYARQNDPDWWTPGLEDARRDIREVCRHMTSGGASLPDDWLVFFWDYLSRCMVTFGAYDVQAKGTFRIYYPIIHSFGEAHQARLGRNPLEVWVSLFQRAAIKNRPEQFAALFIQAGESLLAHGRLGAARQLAEVRAAEELREVFWKEPIVRKASASREDALAPLLATTPPEARGGIDNTQEAREAVFYRAQLAAVFYAQEHPAKLAKIYVDLGFADDTGHGGTSNFYPSLPALALYAYLVMEGAEAQPVFRRRDALLKSKFWKPFFEGTKESGRRLCASLGVWFEHALTPVERDALLKPLRRLYGVEKR